MKVLQEKARALLEGGSVQVVIGYRKGSHDAARPVFVRKAAECDVLILDDSCHANLAVYLQKPEVKALGKPAIVATPATLRTIVQLTSENRFSDGDLIALAVSSDGTVAELADMVAIEQFVGAADGATVLPDPEVQKIWAMPHAERWRFWIGQFSACMKCYACRAACPLCYCERCVVEANQPQWVPVAPHAEGNLEWHVARAMHMAGRCIDCGSCADACPVHIPLNLLTRMLREKMAAEFDSQPGVSAHAAYALSSFKPDDKEGFIR